MTKYTPFDYALIYHRTPLVQWSLYKYKCLWDMGAKDRGLSLFLSFQEEASHTYTLRLC